MKRDTRCSVLTSAIIVLVAFTLYFQYTIQHFNDALLQEKIASCQNDLDCFCDTIDFLVQRDDNWDTHNYEHTLAYAASRMDDFGGVYAELFDQSFNGLSERVRFFQSNPFDPRKYPDLMERFKTEDSGSYIAAYSSDETPTHNLHVLWRWVPTNSEHDNRLLFVVGVSDYEFFSSLRFSSWIAYGSVVLILTSALFIVGSLMLITVERTNRPKSKEVQDDE